MSKKNMSKKNKSKKYSKSKKNYNRSSSNSRRVRANNRREKRQNFILNFILFVIFIAILGLLLFTNNIILKGSSIVKEYIEPIVDKRPALYDECIGKDLNDSDVSDDINSYINDLTSYLNQYNISVFYDDLNIGYKYEYNVDSKYYSASSIKILDALYIYSKADNGELSLDDTVTYKSKYNKSYSTGVKSHKIGDEISLRDLVSYAILYSDNGAHAMLVDFIGIGNYNEYAKSLGTSSIKISSNDYYSNLNISDSYILMSNLYTYLSTDSDNAKELKEYLINADFNYLLFDDNIKVAHKYGHYGLYFNELSIIYDENPYILIVLSKNYNADIENIMKNVSMKIYELHKMYYDNRQSVCYEEIYG